MKKMILILGSPLAMLFFIVCIAIYLDEKEVTIRNDGSAFAKKYRAIDSIVKCDSSSESENIMYILTLMPKHSSFGDECIKETTLERAMRLDGRRLSEDPYGGIMVGGKIIAVNPYEGAIVVRKDLDLDQGKSLFYFLWKKEGEKFVAKQDSSTLEWELQGEKIPLSKKERDSVLNDINF